MLATLSVFLALPSTLQGPTRKIYSDIHLETAQYSLYTAQYRLLISCTSPGRLVRAVDSGALSDIRDAVGVWPGDLCFLTRTQVIIYMEGGGLGRL